MNTFLSKIVMGAAFALATGQALSADEFAIAYRVRGDDTTISCPPYGISDRVAYGLYLWKGGMYGSSPYVFNAGSVAGDLGVRHYKLFVEAEKNPNVWHHIVFTFSRTNRIARMTFDGVSQQSWKLKETESFDEAAFLKKPAKGFACEIADVKVYTDRVPAAAELFAGDVAPAAVAVTRQAFEKAASEPGVTSAFAAWCREKAKVAATFGKGSDLGAWFRLETLRHRLPRLVKLAKTKTDSKFLPFRIDRYSKGKHVPYAVPADATPLTELLIEGAKGEWDCDSFMVYPFADAKDFHLKPSDLKGPTGAVIRADEIDVRTVVCWYQCSNSFSTWMTWVAYGRDTPLLCPESLVHDDRIIKVDTDNRINYLRLSYPDGEKYIDVSSEVDNDHLIPFNINREPVLDAKKFLPMDLRENLMRQYWLTLKTPEDRPAGDYTGTVEMSVGGKPCGTMPIRVRIYPFRLPWPSPHYDIDRPMMHNYLARASISDSIRGALPNIGGGYPHWASAVRRRDAVIRNLVDHGFGNVDMSSFGAESNEWDLAEADAVLLKRNGAVLKPLIGDLPGCEFEYMMWIKYPPKDRTKDTSIAANQELWRKTMVTFSNRYERAQKKLMETYGHVQVVGKGFDEAPPLGFRREAAYFATLNHYGALSFTSEGVADQTAFMTDWDSCPFTFDRVAAKSWHASGCIVTTYAHPHGGAECPDIWRRTKGLVLYFADLDGQDEYILFESAHLWNEFISGEQYRSFNAVQPTFDGVLDSVQWEAGREGIDDQRYATLLKRACRAARKTGDAVLVKKGREFDAWFELSDYRKGDLDQLRREMAVRIAELLKDLAAKGIDTEKLSPPLPPRQNLPLPEPYKLDGDGYAERCMLDLAAAAWEKEGTDAALLKAAEAYATLGFIETAEKTLAKILSNPSATPADKARAELRAGFLGLVPTKYGWTPKKEDLVKARAALDKVVARHLRRIGYQEVGEAADKLMRAFSADGDHKTALEIGEMFNKGPLKAALSPIGKMPKGSIYYFIGKEYYALKEYRRALNMFLECSGSYDALIGIGDAAKELKDYSRACAAYADAIKLLDPVDSAYKIKMLKAKAGEVSKAARKTTKIDDVVESGGDDGNLIDLDE